MTTSNTYMPMQTHVDHFGETRSHYGGPPAAQSYVGADVMRWPALPTTGTPPAPWTRQQPLGRRWAWLKRFLDLTICLVAMILILPLCLLIAACIRLDSKGPALYRQKRVGKDGATISIYKFRTMVHDADRMLHRCLADPELARQWRQHRKLKDDPRITRVGAFLRKTSLDELPQMLNVLLGEMSLVGPRPIVREEIVRYGRAYGLYCRVRPGITGLWQVSGRNDTSYAERVSLDSHYVRNGSLWMDLKILAKTVPTVIFGFGAY
jgi:Undecaprenyl-phosphate galactose phosphotransferase WbaP